MTTTRSTDVRGAVATDCAILLDVGSTNSRAWLVRGTEVLDRRSTSTGVRDAARQGSAAPIREAVRVLVEALRPSAGHVAIAAAGMVSSALGLAEVAHVLAPASLDDLARGARWYQDPSVVPEPILLVPGVRTPAPDEADEDVMRGEETLTLGLVRLGEVSAGDALLSAGSHWKLVRVDALQRVAGSRTSLGGEMVHAFQSSTVLAASLPQGPLQDLDTAWLERGAAAARRDGLLRALFRVRLMDVRRGATTDAQRLSWAIGACIAEDVDGLSRAGALAGLARVHVAGPGAVPVAWVHLLRTAGCDAAPLEALTVERAFVSAMAAVLARVPAPGTR